MTNDDDKTRTISGGRNSAPEFVLTRQHVVYMLRNSAMAMAFIFLLQFFILKSPLEASVMWGLMFGAFAFALAFSHVKRSQR